jgi:hypothetical protein
MLLQEAPARSLRKKSLRLQRRIPISSSKTTLPIPEERRTGWTRITAAMDPIWREMAESAR